MSLMACTLGQKTPCSQCQIAAANNRVVWWKWPLKNKIPGFGSQVLFLGSVIFRAQPSGSGRAGVGYPGAAFDFRKAASGEIAERGFGI